MRPFKCKDFIVLFRPTFATLLLISRFKKTAYGFFMLSCISHLSCFGVSITVLVFVIQVLPKMTSHVVSEIDHILGNRPYSKKDYRS